jgi:hypothetical protein
MTVRLSGTLRDNMIGQYETTIGAQARLQLWTGVPPTTFGDTSGDGGRTMVDEIQLPSDWMTAPGTPSQGSVSKNNTWAGDGANATGVVGHYRLLSFAGTLHEDGTVTVTGGGGDLTVDNTNVTTGQIITITGWTRTQGGGA